jgi:osmotically-inducible protein OsmY
MKSNLELQKDVQHAIKWQPMLHAAEIGVTAKDGVVTLTGSVDSYMKKSEAETVAKSVVGVNAVVERIEIKLSTLWAHHDDNKIAEEVLNALKWNWEVPKGRLAVKIEKGWVTLVGDLEWNFQKEAAGRAIKSVLGVTGLTNNIQIRPLLNEAPEKEGIENAMLSHWAVGNSKIEVEVSGPKIILKGTVESWYQMDEAGRIAWNAPGVSAVDNELVVECDYAFAD